MYISFRFPFHSGACFLSDKFAISMTLLVGIHFFPCSSRIDNRSIDLFECQISKYGHQIANNKSNKFTFNLFPLENTLKQRKEIVRTNIIDNTLMTNIKYLLIYYIDLSEAMIPTVVESSVEGMYFDLSLISLQTIEDYIGMYALPSFNQ